MNEGPKTKFLLRLEYSARQAALRNRNAGLQRQQRHEIVAQREVTLEEDSGVTEEKQIVDLLFSCASWISFKWHKESLLDK